MATAGPMLQDYLTRSGLAGLIPWASGMLTSGASEDEILLDMENQPAFRTRFWMIFTRSNNGWSPISVQEVLEYESTMEAAASALGLQVTRQEMGQWIADDKSVSEMQDRMGIAATVVHMSSPELRAQLDRLYGVTTGDLTRYWLNPKEQAPILQRRFVAAQVAEMASRTGWGQLSASQAEDLVTRGTDPNAALEGFGTLVHTKELFSGIEPTEEDIDVEDQLELISGNEALSEQVKTRGEKRAAKFQEGGGFASGEEGLGGLGSSST